MRSSLLLLAVVLGTAGCSPGERPFRMVQFCLTDTREIKTMISALRRVAAINRLTFFDNSRATEAHLDWAAEIHNGPEVAHPTINVGTVGPTAMGFSAGNFRDAPLQIVVGFSKASDPHAARKLSDHVVTALSQRWRIREVMNVEASGAFPLKDCND